MLLQIYYCSLIKRQPHRTPENYLEQNCRSQEVTSTTNDYSVKQQRSFHPTTKYSDCKNINRIDMQ